MGGFVLKRKGFSEKQAITLLEEHQAGRRKRNLVSKHNVSERSIYRWKFKLCGMEVSDENHYFAAGRKAARMFERNGASVGVTSEKPTDFAKLVIRLYRDTGYPKGLAQACAAAPRVYSREKMAAGMLRVLKRLMYGRGIRSIIGTWFA